MGKAPAAALRETTAADLHKKIPVVDAHQEILDEFVYRFVLEENEVTAGRKSIFDEVYLPVLQQQGVSFVNMAVGGDHVAQVLYSASNFRFWDAHKKIDALLTELEGTCRSFILCRTAADIETARKQEKIGIFLTISGGRPLEGKPNLSLLSSLRSLYRAGLRGIQLTGNGRNRLADGAGQTRSMGQLTDFGVAVVKEAERLGIVVDTAQLSDRGFFDVAELAERPFIDSHTCAAAVSAHPRNISDDRLKVIAEKGGIVGVSFRAALNAADKESPDMEDLLRHIDHIVECAGIDSVALGPDYSAYSTPTCRDKIRGYANRGPDFCDFDRFTPVQSEKYPGWVEGVFYGIRKSDFVRGAESHESFSKMIPALFGLGYTEQEIKKIAGENFLRVYREVLPAVSQ